MSSRMIIELCKQLVIVTSHKNNRRTVAVLAQSYNHGGKWVLYSELQCGKIIQVGLSINSIIGQNEMRTESGPLGDPTCIKNF